MSWGRVCLKATVCHGRHLLAAPETPPIFLYQVFYSQRVAYDLRARPTGQSPPGKACINLKLCALDQTPKHWINNCSSNPAKRIYRAIRPHNSQSRHGQTGGALAKKHYQYRSARRWNRGYSQLAFLSDVGEDGISSSEATRPDEAHAITKRSQGAEIAGKARRRHFRSENGLSDSIKERSKGTRASVKPTIEWKEVNAEDKAMARSQQADRGTLSTDWWTPLQLANELYGNQMQEEPSPSKYRLFVPCMGSYIVGDKIEKFKTSSIPFSTLAFCKYVDELTRSLPHWSRRALHSQNQRYPNKVVERLEEAFYDEDLKQYLSVQAFEAALSFFVKHSYLDKSRALFTFMETVCGKVPVASYNILLRGIATRQNLHVFTLILTSMLGNGVKPNADTWVMLMMTVPSDAAKMQISTWMRAQGLLMRPHTVRRVVRQLISLELDAHIKRNGNLASFIDHIDQKYGQEWMDARTCNPLLQRLGEWDLLPEIFEVLDILEERNRNPSHHTLRILLGQCKLYSFPEGAISVLRQFEHKWNVEPKREDYQILFSMAWQHRLINFGKIIWIAACVMGQTHSSMNSLIWKSLTTATPNILSSRTQEFLGIAGKVIVGKGIQLPIQPTVSRSATGTSGSEPSDSENAYDTVSRFRDLGLKNHRLRSDFVDLLEDALAIDHAWAEDEVMDRKGLAWMIRHSIDAEVVPFSERRIPRRVPIRRVKHSWPSYHAKDELESHDGTGDHEGLGSTSRGQDVSTTVK